MSTHAGVARRLRRSERARSRRRLLPNWTTDRTRSSSSTTTTSTSRRDSCATRIRDALLAHFVHIPWPADWSALPPALRRCDPRRLARERRRRLPHRAVGAQLRRDVRRRRRRRTVTHHRDLGRSARSSTRCASSDAVLEQRGARSRAAREADRACRPDRSVEEHRPRLPRVRALPRQSIRSGTAASRCSRCSIRRGRRSPSTPPTCEQIERAVSDVNGRFGRRRLAAGRPSGRRQLPAVGRRVQAVRRAARERGLRRAQPRGEGRRRSSTRATACSSSPRTPARTRSSRDWALTVNPFDVGGPGRRAARGADDGAGRAASPRSGRCATRCGRTTSRPGSDALLADFDAALARRGST